jgi:hypothetical protein
MLSVPVRAIETTGVIDEENRLRLDKPLPIVKSSRVRVIVLFPEAYEEEPGESEWLYAAAGNPAFDFLKEPQEDIYTLSDGRPFDDQG